jgi:hypothetical protein
MSSTKVCPTCGAENDVIFTNCLYCKSSLPKVDPNSISNEDLIMNAGEWVGKARQHDYSIRLNDQNANEWTGKGIHFIKIKNADIVGNAEKYLSLIQIRAISNSNLLPLHESLRKQLNENKEFAINNDPMTKVWKQQKYVGLVIIILMLLFVLAAIFAPK